MNNILGRNYILFGEEEHLTVGISSWMMIFVVDISFLLLHMNVLGFLGVIFVLKRIALLG
jgi:hypothetical protein